MFSVPTGSRPKRSSSTLTGSYPLLSGPKLRRVSIDLSPRRNVLARSGSHRQQLDSAGNSEQSSSEDGLNTRDMVDKCIIIVFKGFRRLSLKKNTILRNQISIKEFFTVSTNRNDLNWNITETSLFFYMKC